MGKRATFGTVSEAPCPNLDMRPPRLEHIRTCFAPLLRLGEGSQTGRRPLADCGGPVAARTSAVEVRLSCAGFSVVPAGCQWAESPVAVRPYRCGGPPAVFIRKRRNCCVDVLAHVCFWSLASWGKPTVHSSDHQSTTVGGDCDDARETSPCLVQISLRSQCSAGVAPTGCGTERSKSRVLLLLRCVS